MGGNHMEKIPAMQQLKTSMARAKGWASDQAAQVAQAAAEAMEELEGVKADKGESVAVTIPASGWSQDSGDYPYYYDIAAQGVTAADRADVALAPGSLKTAAACGICPTSETLAGKIRLRAAAAPAAEMNAEYRVHEGKE